MSFYCFIRTEAKGDLATIKAERRAFLDSWWNEVQEDVKKRVG